MVSSEFAAILDMQILPALLAHYTEDAAAYKQACVDFAARTGLHWTDVHYPFFLSLDNCHKHPWARKLLLQRRVPEHERQELQVKAKEFAESFSEGMSAEALAGLEQLAARNSAAALHYRRTWCLITHGCTPEQLCKRREAKDKPWLRTVQPEQFMPLTPNTADIHQVVEHMVKNIKTHVQAALQSVIIDGNPRQLDLFKARTYQLFVNEAVRSVGNGPRRCQAIMGSCLHQHQTLRLIAADPGQQVLIVHTSGGEGAGVSVRRRRIWRASGTGGGWVNASKWN